MAKDDEWDDIEAPEGGNEDEELNEEPTVVPR